MVVAVSKFLCVCVCVHAPSLDVMHDASSADYVRVASVDDSVWSRAVVSRLRLQNTLNRIDKVTVFSFYAHFYVADSCSSI